MLPGCQRHRWGDPSRDVYRTERVCQRCGLVKVTRHEPAQLPWIEFERNGRLVGYAGGRTPPCDEGEHS